MFSAEFSVEKPNLYYTSTTLLMHTVWNLLYGAKINICTKYFCEVWNRP